jgi:hypothetical protein
LGEHADIDASIDDHTPPFRQHRRSLSKSVTFDFGGAECCADLPVALIFRNRVKPSLEKYFAFSET